jgi:hypothetical protein
MTQDRNLGLLLDGFLADGPTQAPDRLLLAVTDRIERQRQRPAWFVGRERGSIRRPVRPVVALVAILLVALVGAVVWSVASPRPIPTPAPTPAPAASRPPTAIIQPAALGAGRYLIRTNSGPTTFVVPGGWQVASLGLLDYSLAPIVGRPDDSLRVFFDMHIAAKDAACTEAPEPGIEPTVDAIVADLVADERLVATTPVDVEIGGLHGKRLDVRISPTTSSTCPFMEDGSPTVPLLVDDAAYVTNQPGPDITNGPFWGVDGDDRLRLVLLDRPDGGNVVFIVNSADGTTFDSLVARSMPIIESFTFDTGP